MTYMYYVSRGTLIPTHGALTPSQGAVCGSQSRLFVARVPAAYKLTYLLYGGPAAAM